jgi:mannose-1-phosphate guanylyltransferase
VVLCAGLGTRLRPLTTVRAKAAIPVGGEPIARRIVAWLGSHGVHEVVINLHHLPHTITGTIGDGSDLGATVRYSWEQPAVLGSGGSPRMAVPIVGAETFFLVNGDTLTDVDLHAVADAHRETGALVTLALVPNTSYERYGGVTLGPNGIVTGFVGRGAAARGSFHFIGVQVVDAEAFATVPIGAIASSIGGVYDELMATRPGSVRGFVSEARFFDVGTVMDYWNTSIAFASDASARTIIWDDVEIPSGSIVEECIVTDGVRVPAGMVYRREILLRGPDGRTVAQPLGFLGP